MVTSGVNLFAAIFSLENESPGCTRYQSDPSSVFMRPTLRLYSISPPNGVIAEANGLLLEQCDDEEDYRDPRQVEEWLPVPKKPAPDEPREMTREDICNVDVSSLFALNIVPKRLSDRYTLGDVDPEAMDIGADSLADFQAATHRPIPMALKTETHRDVVAFRSKRR